jgi:hypothetical protein
MLVDVKEEATIAKGTCLAARHIKGHYGNLSKTCNCIVPDLPCPVDCGPIFVPEAIGKDGRSFGVGIVGEK